MKIPKKIILALQKMVNKFIWRGEKARIKAAVLQQTIQKGGLNVPNIMNYYHAAQLSALLCWWSSDRIESWRLEQEGIFIPLVEWVFLQKKDREKMTKTPNMIRDNLIYIWNRLRAQIAPSQSPVYYHPGFAQADKNGNVEIWKQHKRWRLKEWIKDGRIISFQESIKNMDLKEKMNLHLRYQFIQISNFLRKLIQQTGVIRTD